MKRSKLYLILVIIDLILLIGWPICLLGWGAPGWACFLVGIVWCNDFHDLFSHWRAYKAHKTMEEF